MIFLIAADTSTHYLSLSLVSALPQPKAQWSLVKQILCEIPLDCDNWLDKAMRELLHHVPPSQVIALAIGRGPGSFTGLRVSFSYFKTLAALQNLPLIPFSSLQYWRSCFPIEDKLPFLTRANRNLFYGLESPEATFQVLNLPEWYERVSQAYVWCHSWRDNDKFPIIENAWPRFYFLKPEMLHCQLPPLPSPQELLEKSNCYPWYLCKPEYGIEISFSQNPVKPSLK